MLLITYVSGWLVTSVAALFTAAKLRNRTPSGPVTVVALAILAGLLWPLVLVGVIQYGVIAVVTKKVRSGDARSDEDAEADLVRAA